MLHAEAVEPGTFSLLKRLQGMPALKDFFLVGGTALALRYGHRTSVDLDLFTHLTFEKESIIEALEKEFGKEFEYSAGPAKWAVFGFIENIKIDFVKYDHPVIAPVETINGIKLYSTPDLAAMKLNAILGRGVKKDFWDVYELLQHYSLQELIAFHQSKFPKQMLLISLPQSLVYFAEAEESEEPVSLKKQTWQEVKKFIQLKVAAYLK